MTIGVNGHISGDIKAEKVVIHGKIEGNINSDKVYIQSDGHVSGTIESNELIIEPKGVFQGESKIKTAHPVKKVETPVKNDKN